VFYVKCCFTYNDCIGDVCYINVQISLNDNANTELGHSNPLGANPTDTLDNKEIDDTLDEFSKMLSDYSCDGNPTNPAAASSAQTRLELLFTPPDRNDNLSHLSPAGTCQTTPRLPDSVAAAAKENPGASAENEASIR